MMLHTKYQAFRHCGIRHEDSENRFNPFDLYMRFDQNVLGLIWSGEIN